MRLTRRDAVVALASAGVAVTAGATLDPPTAADGPIGERETDALVAAAEVVYPSDVTETRQFVERYVGRRAEERPDWAAGVADAVSYLDEYTRSWRDAPFAALDPAARDDVLRSMGVDAATPNPDGTDTERVRYYVVNDLLYALYSSPTGGRLVGIENPQGHPGGTASYQRGAER
ncbi:MAG: gluconate 2-dehydrogenase subunit 3 family protein [Halobacteriaceae archaeon]